MQTDLINTEEFLSYHPGSMKVYSTTYKETETGGSRWWRDGMVTGNGRSGAIISCAIKLLIKTGIKCIEVLHAKCISNKHQSFAGIIKLSKCDRSRMEQALMGR